MGEITDLAAVASIPEQAQLILDALPRAIILVDLDATIVGWNLVAERLYGWSAQEAIGASLYELITPPELREAGRSIMAEVIAGQTWSGDIRIVQRNGERRTTFSFLGPVRDAAGTIIGAVGAADDVTDVRRLEREASDAADQLLLALVAGRLGTWRWDAETDQTTWDATMSELFGVEPGTYDGTTFGWMSRVHPDDIDIALASLNRSFAEQTDYEMELRAVWPDGTVHWIEGRGKAILDDAGGVIGTIGCAIDITARRTMEDSFARRAAEAEQVAEREGLQRERLEFLAELNDAALNATDHLDLMERAAAAAVPHLGDWCTVHFIPQPGATHVVRLAHADPEMVERAEAIRAAHPFNPESPFGVPAVMRTGRTEFLRNVDRYVADPSILSDLGFDVPQSVRDVVAAFQVNSIVTVALRTKRGIVGAMQFVSAESGRRYDASDVALAEAAAGRIAAALDTAWVTEQQRGIASTLQAALLPDHLPEITGISLAARYWAAGAVSEVGGDFYDVFSIGNERWAIVIGDVCGTGPEAAAITSIARHTIRAAATHGASPAEVLHWVNDAILAEGSGRFCTLAYSTLEARGDGSWRWVCVVGGHPLPILVQPDGTASQVGVPGTLIGALTTIRSTTVETILEPGTTVVLHTDGVTDVRPPHGLTTAQLISLVVSAAGGAPPVVAADTAAGVDAGSARPPAERVAERIGEAIEAILAIPQRDDDIAIVVLRVV